MSRIKMTDSETIQAALLKKLEEYGDSVLESIEKKTRKKTKLKRETSERNHENISSKNITVNLITDSVDERKRKKKKKHSENKDNTGTEEREHNSDTNPQSGKLKHLKSIKCDLGLTEFKNVHLEKDRVKGDSKNKNEPEVVVFRSHKKKQTEKPGTSSANTTEDSNPAFDIKQARYEVRKLGIKGFQGDQKEEAMTALLVGLGAKPPKKKFHNYKEYQEIRKSEIIAEKEKREMEKRLGFKVGKPPSSRKRKRDKNDVGVVDGQVGKWKSGVQFVKKNDLKGFKMSKIKY